MILQEMLSPFSDEIEPGCGTLSLRDFLLSTVITLKTSWRQLSMLDPFIVGGADL